VERGEGGEKGVRGQAFLVKTASRGEDILGKAGGLVVRVRKGWLRVEVGNRIDGGNLREGD
jgi:hypothetical protein